MKEAGKNEKQHQQEKQSARTIVDAFVEQVSDRSSVQDRLDSFCIGHASHHRPIVLVTSGGTAADLEVRSVRCIENFSTGKRGAASIEAFLRKGYAVIHLWREGSASPYGRLVAESLGLGGNQGISTAAIGKLFMGTGDSEVDEEDEMVQTVLDQDPWLTDPNTTKKSEITSKKSKVNQKDPIVLHQRLIDSTRLQTALQERRVAIQECRLLTIPFRAVEEYLAKLKLCSIALRDSQALAMIYLAAAVSDFYVPPSQRSEHKIQSASHAGHMTLELEPVPKVMGLLHREWAPDAFVCSFKLETNSDILRQKVERAVEKYGCHMVVGNILESRYNEVHVFAPSMDSEEEEPVQAWKMETLQKASDPDSLENKLVDTVIQSHFEYISKSCNGTFDKAGMEAVLKAHRDLEEKKRRIERELFWEKVQTVGLEWGGVAAGALLSYIISSALRRRIGA